MPNPNLESLINSFCVANHIETRLPHCNLHFSFTQIPPFQTPICSDTLRTHCEICSAAKIPNDASPPGPQPQHRRVILLLVTETFVLLPGVLNSHSNQNILYLALTAAVLILIYRLHPDSTRRQKAIPRASASFCPLCSRDLYDGRDNRLGRPRRMPPLQTIHPRINSTIDPSLPSSSSILIPLHGANTTR